MVLFMSTLIVASPEDYLNEFNESEICWIDYSFNYVSNNTIRQIHDYDCCNETGCVNLPYDVKNAYLLSKDELFDVSKIMILNSLISSDQINEENYEIIEKSESVICAFYGIDVFKKETKSAGAKLADDLAPELMSKNAANLVHKSYELAKDLKLIKEVNPTALIISGVCYGGNSLENAALTQLNTCQQYIINVRNKNAFYGMVDDLLDCHNHSIDKLNLAKLNPDLWVRSTEQIIKEKVSCIGSKLDPSIGSCEVKQKDYQFFLSKIRELKQVSTITNFSGEAKHSSDVAYTRFTYKKKVVTAKYKIVSSKIFNANVIIDKQEKNFFNRFFEPAYNFSSIKSNLSKIDYDSNKADELIRNNKLNSAINLLDKSAGDMNVLDGALNKEINKKRNLVLWVKILLIILGILFVYILLKRIL